MRNTFKKFMPIAMFALVLLFVFSNQSFAAIPIKPITEVEPIDSFENFLLSEDGGVKADYSFEDKILVIKGAGTISHDKWVELVKKFSSKNYADLNKRGWYGVEDFDIKFSADEGKKIALCNSEVIPHPVYAWKDGLFMRFDGNIDFNNSVDTSKVTDMANMFQSTKKFNSDISNWDVSNVKYMYSMFNGADSFNQDLSAWDTSSVENMGYMFSNTTAFNQDLSAWDISNVTQLYGMFEDATAFNGDVSGWDTSSVVSMETLFSGATSFSGDVSNWNTSNLENAGYLFYESKFNGDISKWDTSKLYFCEGMFGNLTIDRIDFLNRENPECYIYSDCIFNEETVAEFIGFKKFAEFEWYEMPYYYWISKDDGEFVKADSEYKKFDEGSKYILERQITPHLEIGDYEGKYTGKAITLDDISHSCKDIVGYEIEGGGTWSLDLNGYNGIDSGTHTVLVTFTPNDTDKYRTVTKEVEITMPKSENEGEEVIGTGNPSGRTITNLEIADKEAAQAGTGLPFGDIKETDWFYAGVKESFDKGVLLGTSDDKFTPYMDVTRGMMVTVLYRINNEPIEKIIDTYPDVVKDTYYEKAVSWGTTNKVVKGYGTEYKPEKHITRQEMIAMLYRYYNSKKKDTASADVKSLETFTDRSEVLDYAVNPMAWAVSNKLIVGRTKDTLAPKGELTRAELAVILQRFAKMMK